MECTLRIDEFLNYGEENEVQVAIRGSALPNARWYPGEGIYREVWMLEGEQLPLLPGNKEGPGILQLLPVEIGHTRP